MARWLAKVWRSECQLEDARPPTAEAEAEEVEEGESADELVRLSLPTRFGAVQVSDFELNEALSTLVLNMPLRVAGSHFPLYLHRKLALASVPLTGEEWRTPLARSYGSFCERQGTPGDCLGLFKDGPGLDGEDKRDIALALSVNAALEARDAELRGMFSTTQLWTTLSLTIIAKAAGALESHAGIRDVLTVAQEADKVKVAVAEGDGRFRLPIPRLSPGTPYPSRDTHAGSRRTKKTRWALLNNPWHLTVHQGQKLSELKRTNQPLYQAYLLKGSLARGMDYRQPKRASEHLDSWCQWASHCQLEPFVRLAKTIKQHKDGILAYVETGLSNGAMEGINNQIRAISRRAYGFRNLEAFKAMIFLCCGGLELTPPLPMGA